MKNFDIKFSFVDETANPLSGFEFGNVEIIGDKGAFDSF